MKNIKLALGYGFLVWAIPFATAFAIFPLRETDRAFFESIMAVAVVSVTLLFAVKYAKKVKNVSFDEWIKIGVLWVLICVAIDLPLFTTGPVGMSFEEYFKDIAFTYLVILIITSGIGYYDKLK